MLRKSRIYSITAGIIAFLLGLFTLISVLIGLMGSGGEGLLLTIAILFLLCGAFGTAGGVLLGIRLRPARVLLLVAALIGLPLGLVFFMIFMYARKGTLRLLDNDAFRPTNIGASPW
jgi:O-antigen ligase